jgi:ankyrin repeat protein
LKQQSIASCSIQVRYILQYQVEGYTQRFPKDVSGLQHAVSFGLKEIVKVLIGDGAYVQEEDSNGMTSLHSAALNGYEEVVKFLLKKGADTATKDHNGMTAVHWAATNEHEAVVQILLKEKVDNDTETKLGQTALYQAARNGHDAVVGILLVKGANPNLRETQYGRTPLPQVARGAMRQLCNYC